MFRNVPTRGGQPLKMLKYFVSETHLYGSLNLHKEKTKTIEKESGQTDVKNLRKRPKCVHGPISYV